MCYKQNLQNLSFTVISSPWVMLLVLVTLTKTSGQLLALPSLPNSRTRPVKCLEQLFGSFERSECFLTAPVSEQVMNSLQQFKQECQIECDFCQLLSNTKIFEKMQATNCSTNYKIPITAFNSTGFKIAPKIISFVKSETWKCASDENNETTLTFNKQDSKQSFYCAVTLNFQDKVDNFKLGNEITFETKCFWKNETELIWLNCSQSLKNCFIRCVKINNNSENEDKSLLNKKIENFQENEDNNRTCSITLLISHNGMVS